MIDFMGKRLKNPLIAASCIATESEESILRLAKGGVQGTILKSCADYRRERATMGKRRFAYEKSSGYTYASSDFEREIMTLDEAIDLMHKVRPKTDILLIPSFTADNLCPESWIPSCKRLEEAGADGIQLDFFYMGCLVGSEGFSQKLVRLLKDIQKAVNIPIMPKLNVNLPKDYVMPLLVEAGIEYVSLLDSVRSPYLEERDGEYRISDRLDVNTTSCFGHWQLPLTLGYAHTAAKYGLKICAGGGITSAEDVKKLLAVGATTVQSATLLTKLPLAGAELLNVA